MKDKKAVIECVLPESIAEEVGIEPGDIILSVNNEKIEDIFDYKFQIANEYLLVEVQKKDEEIWEIEIEKEEYEDLGIEFKSSMIDEAKSCTNQCIFCFIDQLPEGMRKTMYFKDDDSRLSFLTGNYVTLTNMKYNDIDKIINYKMSPINVSVHTTNPELRVFMLKNKFAGEVLEKIKRLTEGGITVNCQIVLCKGINDGTELQRTLADLTALYPGVRSISVVPVGLTKFREGLCELEPFDAAESHKVITEVEKWQERLKERNGTRMVYLADEFYIMAQKEIPGYEDYEDFPQIENGVGLIALFKQEFQETFEKLSYWEEKGREVSIATGVLAYKFIGEMAKLLEERYGIKINVYEIKNLFFGENVTVTGLITGGDIASQLKGKELGSELLISRSMLKAGEELFLDDYTIKRLALELNTKVTVIQNSGKEFIEKILGIT
ncbi:MAG: DUF512 domain-containing protein [Clostridia bacterium]|nr:DUF512 domain-containing protein [Clostridia bacterium]